MVNLRSTQEKFLAAAREKRFCGKKPSFLILISLAIICAFPAVFPPKTAYASPSYTSAMKTLVAEAILRFGQAPYEYNRYALHDFDGDGIPEILLGTANPGNPLFVRYSAYKHNISSESFEYIGTVAESRYLMRDRYSNALIGFYENRTAGGYPYKIYRNYYIANQTLSRNTMLALLEGNDNAVVYDGVNYPSGYYRNDMAVVSDFARLSAYEKDRRRDEFKQEEAVYRGSYEEVVVHDYLAGREVAYIAALNWKPSSIASRPVMFSNNDKFTKTWQGPMYDLISANRKSWTDRGKEGPADTKTDSWELNQSVVKEDYQRYALHDLDGDGVPELFLAVQRSMKLSFDMYKYWNGGMRFIGSFDSYSKYLAKADGGVFAFNPLENKFYAQSANRISFTNNAVKNDTLLTSFYRDGKYHYQAQAPDKNGAELVNVPYSNYFNSLAAYVNGYTQIRTFDLEMVPPTTALIMYVKTKAFTQY